MRAVRPILYSFRRCPYAIRARFALKYAGIVCWLREVSLRNKPEELIRASAKATVPVLVLSDGRVLDESLDIISWALQQNDPDDCLGLDQEQQRDCSKLTRNNDEHFTSVLHRYKYPDRHPEAPHQRAIHELLRHLEQLEERLAHHRFLISDRMSLADIAIFPFVRQASRVDEKFFSELPYKKLLAWLEYFYHHQAYWACMERYPVWSCGDGELF